MLRRTLAAGLCSFPALLAVLIGVAIGQDSSQVPATTEELVDHLVRSALKSELEGDAKERAELLDQALLVGPDVPVVNWLAGRVELDGDWLTVKDCQQLIAADKRLDEYRRQRDELDGNPRRELTLARWCAKNDWKDTAKFHYARLLRYPDASEAARDEALRILDLRMVDGQFFTASELAEYEQQAKKKKEDFESWRTKIVAWRKAILLGSDDARQQALIALREVNDAQVILAAEASLYDSPELFAAELIALIGKFREFEATQALVRFALLTPSQMCLQEAVERLKPRPVHDYYPGLMVLLQAPLKTEFRVTNPNGQIRYEQVVAQQGPLENRVAIKVRDYQPVDDIRHTNTHTGRWTNTVLFRNKRTSGQSTSVSEKSIDRNQLHNLTNDPTLQWDAPIRSTGQDVMLEIESYLTALSVERKVSLINQSLILKNERVFYLLEQTSPEVFPRNPSVWWSWWRGYHETQSQAHAQRPAPTRYLYSRIGRSYTQFFPIRVSTSSQSETHTVRLYSCFIAGTKVQTQTGPQPIEAIRTGDRVLARDVDTGELAFKLVYGTTLREPTPVIQLKLEGEEVVATKGHPFWVAEKGWTMAKELRPGDVLHALDGPRKLQEVTELRDPQPAYNLVVADFNSYFVGEAGLLAHDNTYWKPTPVRVPGMQVSGK